MAIFVTVIGHELKGPVFCVKERATVVKIKYLVDNTVFF
jgi:hypothetical protein